MWKGGSEPQLLPPDPRDPVDPLDPRSEFQIARFDAQARYLRALTPPQNWLLAALAALGVSGSALGGSGGALGGLRGALGRSGEGLEELWEALGELWEGLEELCKSSGWLWWSFGKVWRNSGIALGEYLQTPDQAHSGRYVILFFMF